MSLRFSKTFAPLRLVGSPGLRTAGALCLLLPSCDAETTSQVHVGVDVVPSIPKGEPADPHGEDGTSLEPADASDCGTRTGRTPEGSCIFLPTRMVKRGEAQSQQVQIPAGRFVRGSIPRGYDGDRGRERPALRWAGQPPRLGEVESFWIDLVEVTRENYGACVDAGDCTPARCLDGGDGTPQRKMTADNLASIPQTCVTHAQAKAYCGAEGVRLPTEAEWEFAGRGVDARIHPWGNDIRDEISSGLGPVGLRVEESYFGIRGLGSNAWEWVADRYVEDAGFADYLTGAFRNSDGPLAKMRRTWETQLACDDAAPKDCRAKTNDPERYVVKSGRLGTTSAARVDTDGLHPPEKTLEGWLAFAQHPLLGFRCAASPEPGDLALTTPADPRPIPTTTADGALEFFGGVAEAVNLKEAKTFCKRLRVDATTDWRLPTRQEVIGSLKFRGPGPFWAQDGAVGQTGSGADAPWTGVEAGKGEALLARCVRAP